MFKGPWFKDTYPSKGRPLVFPGKNSPVRWDQVNGRLVAKGPRGHHLQLVKGMGGVGSSVLGLWDGAQDALA